tara:strand:- start:218 stop:586 length:369 start_codon:yes stop_codon:yes gene_type:complete
MVEYTSLTIRERAIMSHIFAANAEHPHLVSKSATISEIVADYPGDVYEWGECDPHMDMFVAVKEMNELFPMREYRGVLSSLSQKGALKSDDWGQGEFWAITADGWAAAVDCNHREEMSAVGY